MTPRKPPTRWTAERDALLTQLWNDGLSQAGIAERLGASEGAIQERRSILALPKRNNPTGWTQGQIDLLKERWEQGDSAAQIAAMLPGKTRNAVIGKIHRLGLTDLGRAVPARPGATYRPAKAPKVKAVGHRPPKPGPQNKPALVLGAYRHEPNFERAEIIRAKKTETGAMTVARVAAGAGVESPNAVPLLDYVRGCKWPIGERGQVHYCCNPQVEGRTYCEGHLALSIAADQPKGMKPRDASRLTRFDRVERDAPRWRAEPMRSLWDDAREAA